MGSAFENPAAALVLDFMPCRPVRDVWFLPGLVVIKPWSAVPFQCPSSPSSSSEESPSSDVGLGAVLLSCSNAVLFFASRVSASFFFLVSARIAVIESTGREMLETVEALRVLASDLSRKYSA